ncbi:MAG: hypothetical protein ACK41F_04565 [Fimbriimonadaceae bacterium]
MGANAPAIVITRWDFNSVPPDSSTTSGTLAPAVGTGAASLVGGVTGSFASGDASGGSTDPASGDDSAWNVTTFAAQGQESGLRGVRFDVPTTGFEQITVRWDQRHSNASSRFGRFSSTRWTARRSPRPGFPTTACSRAGSATLGSTVGRST